MIQCRSSLPHFYALSRTFHSCSMSVQSPQYIFQPLLPVFSWTQIQEKTFAKPHLPFLHPKLHQHLPHSPHQCFFLSWSLLSPFFSCCSSSPPTCTLAVVHFQSEE